MWQALSYLIFSLSALSKTLGQDDSGWCYEGSCGPKSWTGICQTGKAQSPISIIPSTTKKIPRGRNLIFSADYFAVNSFEIVNTGRTVTIKQQRTGGGNLQVKGAGWNGTYDFLEMNFHWGSEHLVKGTRFGLELQIVHQQTNGQGGKGILAIIFAVTSQANKALEPIINILPDIEEISVSPVRIRGGLNLSSLFPPVWDIFRYQGSLTTPPCTESVLWSLFTQRMPISQTQVDAFSTVLDLNGNSLKRNYRPTSPAITTSRKRIYWMPINKANMRKLAF